jgi:hypothetical protein
MKFVRSVLAVASGYFVKGLIAGVFLVSVGWQTLDEPSSRLLVILIFWRIVACIVAGYVTGMVAGGREIGHAAALAVLGILVGLGSLLAGVGDKEPLWAQLTHLVIMGPLLLLGGYLRRLQVAYGREPDV